MSAVPVRKLNLIYHVCAMEANDIWLRNVKHVRDHWAVWNHRKVIAVAVGDGLHPLSVVQEAFGKPKDAEWLEIPNDKRLREVATFLPLLERIKSTNADEASFYAHTKGNSTRDDPRGAARWRNAMYSKLLNEVDVIRETLRVTGCVGCCKIVWPKNKRSPFPTDIKVGNWMYAGTFFWFRHDKVFNHPNWNDVRDDRYAAEAWMSGIFRDDEAVTLLQPWPADRYPTRSPYNPGLYSWIYDDPATDRPVKLPVRHLREDVKDDDESLS